MKSRLEEGFWCFPVPIWYKFIENKNWWWKIIIKDEENYKTIKYVLEKYASWELNSIANVSKYLNKKWIKVWTIKNWKLYNTDLVSRMLRNILYTWYLKLEKWWIKKTKAKHQALISLKTYDKIQKKLNQNDRLNNNIKSKIEQNNNRIDKNNDFPLRWFLYCEESKAMLSGGWSQWKTKKIPYYTFPKKSPLRWKSLNRNNFHKDFEEILKKIKPKEELIEVFEKIIDNLKKKNELEKIDNKKILNTKINKIDNQINIYIERIWNTNSEILLKKYEEKIEKLEEEKKQIFNNFDKELKNVWTPLKNKIKLVKNSLSIWEQWNLEIKKSLIENIFPEWIPINKKKQVWTPTFSLIYQSFSIWKRSIFKMVDPPRLELGTLSLRGICSTNWAISPY